MKSKVSRDLMTEVQRSDEELKAVREQFWKTKMIEIGQRIQKARKSNGLSQEQLAEAVGVSLNSISSIERGVFSPALDTFHELCDTLMISADFLLFGTTESEELPVITQKFLRMTPYEQKVVERLLLDLHWVRRLDVLEIAMPPEE